MKQKLSDDSSHSPLNLKKRRSLRVARYQSDYAYHEAFFCQSEVGSSKDGLIAQIRNTT